MSVKVANTAANVLGQRLALEKRYKVTDYGLVAGGVTDNLAALVTLLAVIPITGGEVYFPTGVYRFSGPLTSTQNSIRFVGDGPENSILLWDDTADKGLTFDTASNAAVTSVLTGNSLIGEYDINVTSAVGYAAGQWAYLEDNDATHGTFMTQIRSVAGLVVTLKEALPVDMLTANVATLRAYVTYPLLEGIEVRGLQFASVNRSAVANKLTLLFLSRCHKPLVDHCGFDGAVAPLITTRALKNGLIRNCWMRNAISVAGAGIEAQTSTGLMITECVTNDTRFGITLARSPYSRIVNCYASGFDDVSGGRSYKLAGGSNFSLVAACTGSDTGFTGVRVENCSYCMIDGIVSGMNAKGQVGGPAIQLSEGTHNTVQNCMIYGGVNSPDGIINSQATVIDSYCSIQNNTITGCKQYGIYCQGKRNRIIGNKIGTSQPDALIYIPPDAGYNIIDGNVIVAEGGTVGKAIHTVDGVGHNVIGLNKYTTALNLHATDTVVASTQWKLPTTKTTNVPTAADLNETVAWDKTITGGTFSVADQCFEAWALFVFAANNNDKTISGYVGNTKVSRTYVGADANGANVRILIKGIYDPALGGGIYYDIKFESNVVAQDQLFGSFNGSNWAVDQHIKFTMQNGVANANDIIFSRGKIVFEGVLINPTPIS